LLTIQLIIYFMLTVYAELEWLHFNMGFFICFYDKNRNSIGERNGFLKTWLKSLNFPVICMHNRDIYEVRQYDFADMIFIFSSEQFIPKLTI
jgi:hypothetical protein